MILLIDNYDSFSYNLYQLIGTLNPDIKVVRNDSITAIQAEKLNPSHIVLSPGPGRPKDAGICEDIIRLSSGKIPILGVCLGHQAICEVYGAEIVYAKSLMHGKKSNIKRISDSRLFRGLPNEFEAARYHSLAADAKTIVPPLKVIAASADGEVMAAEVEEKKIYGLQFHPESILTPIGKTLIKNFLDIE